jgi:hypothetical protein
MAADLALVEQTNTGRCASAMDALAVVLIVLDVGRESGLEDVFCIRRASCEDLAAEALSAAAFFATATCGADFPVISFTTTLRLCAGVANKKATRRFCAW